MAGVVLYRLLHGAGRTLGILSPDEAGSAPKILKTKEGGFEIKRGTRL